MAAASEHDSQLEIAHVLFIDIVGYTKLLINQQSDLLRLLNEVVRSTEQFRSAEQANTLVRLPTGDGMALAFSSSPDAPVRCAMEIDQRLKEHPQLNVRMGIHSGPVDAVKDVNDRTNIAGAGINMAQRVMDCGDAGHILLSKRVADDLGQYERWQPHLYDLGECEVKHGVKIEVVNLFTGEVGRQDLPEKLTRDRKAQAVIESRAAVRGRRKILLGIAVFALLTATIAALWIRSRPAPSDAVPALVAPAVREKSIAVLPFENLSAEKDDAFFADGIQDDVLSSLGKIKDLTVIARSSVMTYRGEAVAGKLREIGQALRVAHVLQGSVRRAANRVVINVALVDTRNDRQLWTERYERTITDALSLQGELALEIARALRATLTPAEESVVATKPTENPDAYVLYLRAREIEIRFDSETKEYEAAAKLYQEAIDLDPKFALARARLSYRLSFITQGRDSVRMQKALAEVEEALRLQPSLGEARLALGYYFFWEKKDFDRALAELSRAAELIPSSADVWNTRAHIYKRQDKFRERIAALRHAETLDPRNTYNLGLLVQTFRAVRDWPEAMRTRERINALLPPERQQFSWPSAWGELRMNGVNGVLDPLKKSIAEAPVGTPPGWLSLARYQLAMLERDYPAAERYLRETPVEVFGDDWRESPPKVMEEALLAVARGAERTVIERSLVMARQECAMRLSNEPTAIKLHGALGLINAFGGRKEEAIREGRRWLELEDYSILEKNDAAANLALIYARVGEPDEAIKLIEKLLTVPATLGHHHILSMTQADLKWRWVWDPLRNDPRFQKILAGPVPQTVY